MGGAASSSLSPGATKGVNAKKPSNRRSSMRSSMRRGRVYENSSLVDHNLSISYRPGQNLLSFKDPNADTLIMTDATKVLLMEATKKLLVVDGFDMREEVVNMILASMKLNVFTKDAIIAKEGAKVSHVFLVESGIVGIYKKGTKIDDLERGALIGESALLHDIVHSTSVVALEECRLWRLDRNSFRAIQKRTADLSTNTREQHLRAVPDLAQLPKEKIMELISKLTTAKFGEGEELYSSGKCTSKVMLIEEGFVELIVPVDSHFNDLDEAHLLLKSGIHDPTKKHHAHTVRENRSETQFSMDKDSSVCYHDESAEASKCASRRGSVNLYHCHTSDDRPSGRVKLPVKAPQKRFGPGCVLGIGVLRSNNDPSGWPWVDEVVKGVPTLGAVAPLSIVARGNVRVAYFTVFQFQKLFGPSSSFYFFSSTGVGNYYDSVRASVALTPVLSSEPSRQGSFRTMLSSAMERVSSMVDKCSHHETPFEQTIFTLDDFEKIDTLANVALGSVALGYFRPRAHEHEHVHDDDDDLDHNKLHNVELARAAGEEQSSLHFAPVISGDATRLHQKNSHSTSHHTVYVLKLISKVSVYRQNQANRIITEASILSTLKHPFICRLYGKFQTPKDLVLVLERVSGGDLWSVMYEASDAPRVARLGGSYLSLDLVRFYIASLILALEFMHKKDIAYRNLKPENVLIDDRGYVRLVGFGFAKKYPFIDASGEHQHRSFTFCGTLEYLAPEIALAMGHSTMVDNWALGVLLYELLAGETPFAHLADEDSDDGSGKEKERKTNGDTRILAGIIESQIIGIPWPHPLTSAEHDLGLDIILDNLLKFNASERIHLCTKSKRSPLVRKRFLKNFDWDALREKSMTAPYVPPAEMCGHPYRENDPIIPHEDFTGDDSVFADF